MSPWWEKEVTALPCASSVSRSAPSASTLTRQRSTYWLSKESGVSLRSWLTVRAGGANRWMIWCETLIRMIGFAPPLVS